MLRYFQQPSGVYHGSVFYQMSGSVGPSCLCLDADGNLYVGQYDVKGSSQFLSFVVHFLIEISQKAPLRESFMLYRELVN